MIHFQLKLHNQEIAKLLLVIGKLKNECIKFKIPVNDTYVRSVVSFSK